MLDSLPVRIFNRASDGYSLPVRKNQIYIYENNNQTIRAINY